MPIQTEEEIQNLILKASEAEALIDPEKGGGGRASGKYEGPGGREYRHDGPWKDDPHGYPAPDHVYFYFLKFDTEGRLTSSMTFTQIDQDLDTTIARLIEDELGGTTMGIADIEDVLWRRPSYLAVYLDFSTWELIDESATDDPNVMRSFSLHFPVGKYRGLNRIKNDTFYNSENRTIQITRPGQSATTPVRYLACRNLHLIPPTNQRRKPQTRRPTHQNDFDDYKFDIAYKVPIPGMPPEKKLIITIDPGGRNTGP